MDRPKTSDSQVEKCSDLIKKAKVIAVLTGAGISTNAGIPDFRGPKGLYVTRQYDPDTVFDISYFYNDPKPFYAFARDFITFEEKIKPTFTHQFLATLERQKKIKGIVTQNIDSLHQMAGSRNVYEMHGSFWISHCLDCRQEFSYKQMKEKIMKEDVPHCGCQGLIKPDVVFFGENVKYMFESAELAAEADLFFVIGTSCVVYPAASIPSHAKGEIVIVNKQKVDISLSNIVLEVDEDLDKFFQKVAQALGIFK